ncbi:MAG: ammonium transporter [Firmicutes bacterium]|nr:ammonium transporter [Bacillota bacterium]
MHLGFAMVESGFVRAKNTVSILMKNVATVIIGVVSYFLVGFAFMFGEDRGGFIGLSGFALNGLPETVAGVPLTAFWVFQAMFAATCATIVSGAVAERVRFKAYLAFGVFMTAFIYPIIGHWVWGGGWLSELGFHDFAGSTVVHSAGAWAGLVFAAMLGPRLGKYGEDGQAAAVPGHNLPLGTIGVLLLWFGWFGFNGGSTIDGTTAAIADIIAVTMLGGAAGGLAAMLLSTAGKGRADMGVTLNGILAGLVGITAGADVFSPWAALAVGAMSGAVMVWALGFVERVLRVDDPVGAVSVHGACGVLGTLAVGLFARDGGLFTGGGWQLLGAQVAGVLAVFLWTAIASVAALRLIRLSVPLRVTEEEELQGLDLAEHGSLAYGEELLSGVSRAARAGTAARSDALGTASRPAASPAQG